MHLCLYGGWYRGIRGILYIGLITVLSFFHLALAGIRPQTVFFGGNVVMELADSNEFCYQVGPVGATEMQRNYVCGARLLVMPYR